MIDPQTSTAPKPPIAVIGAGFSGALAALHLLRRLPADQPVVLCDRAPGFPAPADTASGDGGMLLNVRAGNMSAFADEKNHFEAWLSNHAADAATGSERSTAGLFATRGLYARYLRQLLDQAAGSRLTLMGAEVLDVLADGPSLSLQLSDGKVVATAGVVLALGNPPAGESAQPQICNCAWSEKALAPLDDSKPVLIAGTGLAMTDLAVTLRARGYRGHIIAISPAGLLPNRHGPSVPWPTPRLSLAEAASLRLMLKRLREEVAMAADAGIGWRSVIDSMRPVTADIWTRLPVAERRRFLRHGRRYWDALRHRMAPSNADAIDAMLTDGTLTVHAGRITRMAPTDDAVHVTWYKRGSHDPQVLDVQRVIKAQELQPIVRTDDRLVRTLLDRRLIKIDDQGLGIAVTDELTVIGAEGVAAERLWALGPIVRGVFWECVAVPDIRRQAGNVAVSAVAKLREAAPRKGFALLG